MESELTTTELQRINSTDRTIYDNLQRTEHDTLNCRVCSACLCAKCVHGNRYSVYEVKSHDGEEHHFFCGEYCFKAFFYYRRLALKNNLFGPVTERRDDQWFK